MIGKLLLIGAVIGSNNLAAALAIGTLGSRHFWRVIIIFGFFEFLMPLTGIWIGVQLSSVLGEITSVVSVFILLVLAGLSFFAATKPPKTNKQIADKVTTLHNLIILELGLSMDNLVAGFSIGIRSGALSPLLLSLTIAAFSVAYTFTGLKLGRKISLIWQNRAQVFAGILLTFLAGFSWFDII